MERKDLDNQQIERMEPLEYTLGMPRFASSEMSKELAKHSFSIMVVLQVLHTAVFTAAISFLVLSIANEKRFGFLCITLALLATVLTFLLECHVVTSADLYWGVTGGQFGDWTYEVYPDFFSIGKTWEKISINSGGQEVLITEYTDKMQLLSSVIVHPSENGFSYYYYLINPKEQGTVRHQITLINGFRSGSWN